MFLQNRQTMLKIDRSNKVFVRVDNSSLGVAGLRERYDLQQMIARAPEAFFAEIGETLLLLGQEIKPSDVVDDRIDLLALDESGTVVVIELKRGSNKLQLLQSVSYAAMVSNWSHQRLIEARQNYAGGSAEDAEESIEQFLKEDIEAINQRQRMILIAEDFDFAVLATAEWMFEKYEIDVRCFKLVLTVDGPNEYVGCVRIFPQSDLAQEASSRRTRTMGSIVGRWSDWDQAIAGIQNKAVALFIREQIAAGRQNYLKKRLVRFFVQARWRWSVSAKTDFAYVWQNGRFDGDVEFWRSRLSSSEDVNPVKRDLSLRFRLYTEKDFERFLQAATVESRSMRFVEPGDADSDEVDGVE